MRQVIRSFEPDIIHVCTVTKLSPAGVREMRNTPTVMDLRDYGLLFPNLHKILPKEEFCGFSDDARCRRHAGFLRYYFELLRVNLHSRNFSNLSAFIVNSKYLKEIAQRMGMEPAVVLNPPITVADSQPESNNRLRDSVFIFRQARSGKGHLSCLRASRLFSRKYHRQSYIWLVKEA